MTRYTNPNCDFTKLDYIRVGDEPNLKRIWDALERADEIGRDGATLVLTPEDFRAFMITEEGFYFLQSQIASVNGELEMFGYPLVVVGGNKTLETSRIVYPEVGVILYRPRLSLKNRSSPPDPKAMLNRWQSGQDLTERLPYE